MKKFLFVIAIAASSVAANAQTAIESSKFFDNWYFGIGGGVSAPLSCDPMFPLNGMGDITVGKDKGISDEHQGKYLGLTETGSVAVKHLADLKAAGDHYQVI